MLEVRFFGIEPLTQFSREADLHPMQTRRHLRPSPPRRPSTMITMSNFMITSSDLAVALGRHGMAQKFVNEAVFDVVAGRNRCTLGQSGAESAPLPGTGQ